MTYYITTLISILAIYVTYKISYDQFWFSGIDRLIKFSQEYETLPTFIGELYISNIKFLKGLALEDMKIISRYSLTKKDVINFRNGKKLLVTTDKDRLCYAPKWRFLLRKRKRNLYQTIICLPFFLFAIASISFPIWSKYSTSSPNDLTMVFVLILGVTLYLEVISLKEVISIGCSYQILKKIAFYPKDKIKNL